VLYTGILFLILPPSITETGRAKARITETGRAKARID